MCLHEVGFILHDYGGGGDKRVIFLSPKSRASLLYSCGGTGKLIWSYIGRHTSVTNVSHMCWRKTWI